MVVTDHFRKGGFKHLHTQQPAERIRHLGSFYQERLACILSPLLQLLDGLLDRRLVHTFSLLVEAIIRFRNRQHGLLLKELGAYMLSPYKAPAGTKRISNLLHSGKWQYCLLSDWLRAQAKAQLAQWPAQPVLLHRDESVVEKPESLCPVRSTPCLYLQQWWSTRLGPGSHHQAAVPGAGRQGLWPPRHPYL